MWFMCGGMLFLEVMCWFYLVSMMMEVVGERVLMVVVILWLLM